MKSPLPDDSPILWRKQLRRTADGPLSARDEDERALLLEQGAASSSEGRAAARSPHPLSAQRPSRKFAQLSQRTPTHSPVKHHRSSPSIVGPIGTYGWQPGLPDASRLPPPLSHWQVSPDDGRWKPTSRIATCGGSGDDGNSAPLSGASKKGLNASSATPTRLLDLEALAFGVHPTSQAAGSAFTSSLDPTSPSYFSSRLLSFAGDARKQASFKASVAKTVIAVELARSWTDLIVLVRPLVFGLPLSVGHQPRRALRLPMRLPMPLQKRLPMQLHKRLHMRLRLQLQSLSVHAPSSDEAPCNATARRSHSTSAP